MDYTLFHAINGLAGHIDAVDDVFEVLSGYGVYFLLAALPVLWFWPVSRTERDHRQWGVIVAVVAAVLALGVNQVIIRLWDRPRPFMAHHVTQLVTHARDASFPSDHTTFAFAIAVALFLISRRIGLAALLFAALIGFSRVYVGVHYPTDVLAGALIGTVVAVVLDLTRPYLTPLVEPPLQLARRLHLA